MYLYSFYFFRQIATSKFEPTYARQAYPCFDEPNLKAKYKVHLLKPKDESYIALSNYPVAVSICYISYLYTEIKIAAEFYLQDTGATSFVTINIYPLLTKIR